ncbi:MAG: VMAP-C domain-containing protein, partial [Archangium sp.]
VVLDIVDYAKIVGDQHAQTMLKAMRTMKTLVFVGCGEGLVDPNLGALFKWTRDVFAGSELVHYVLAVDSEVDKLRQQHPPEERLRVIPYGPNYSDLGPFLRSLKPSTSGPGSSGGGGSAGGRGVKMHAAAASSAPTGSSSLRPFRNRSLLQQLTNLLQAMKLPWSTIEELFWESVPETWPGQLLDESVAEAERYMHLVDVLSSLPEQVSTGKTYPLLEFALRSRNHAATSMGALDSWRKDAARHLGVSPASLMAQEQKIAGERHVLVKIERASSEQFLLQAWLGDERGNMQALLDEPQRCKREELPRVLSELWSSNDWRKRLARIPPPLLTVEFLLPDELLSEDVEQWRIPPDEPPLGCKYRVVVRPLERIYAEVKQFLEDMSGAFGAWYEKWGLLPKGTTGSDSLLWLRSPEDLNEDRLQALLLRDKVISLLLILTPPTCSESLRREVLSRAMRQGLPIALWVRLEKAAPDSVEELFTLLSKDLRQLRHAVREERRKAQEMPTDDKHLGRYLSLLWDDPDHRPPDAQVADYSAPTTSHGSTP